MIKDVSNIGLSYLTRSPIRKRKEVEKLGITSENFHLFVNTTPSRLVQDVLIYTDVNPSYNHSRALITAVDNNNIDAVRLLLKDGRVAVSARSFLVFKIAIKKNHIEIFYLLKKYAKSLFAFNIINKEEFYEVITRSICTYERIEMLDDNEIIPDLIDLEWFEPIFIKYDPRKQLFLDTLVANYGLTYSDQMVHVSTVGTVDVLEYVMNRFLNDENNDILTEDAIDSMLFRATFYILPDNVKFLLDFSNNIDVEEIIDAITETKRGKDLYDRSDEEKTNDLKRIIDIVEHSGKINLWVPEFVDKLITLLNDLDFNNIYIINAFSEFLTNSEHLIRILDILGDDEEKINTFLQSAYIKSEDLIELLGYLKNNNDEARLMRFQDKLVIAALLKLKNFNIDIINEAADRINFILQSDAMRLLVRNIVKSIIQSKQSWNDYYEDV